MCLRERHAHLASLLALAGHMTAVAYEPFALNLELATEAPAEWLVDRVPADKHLANHIERWRLLDRDGWNITALVAPDSKTVIAIGCR